MLHHIEDRPTYLKSLAGYLKPTGKIAVIDFRPGQGGHLNQPELRVTKEQTDTWMAAAGLKPTEEIDLFWHLHMLSPVAYVRDCQRLFGFVLDHDGGFGKEPAELPVLKEVFLQTAERWVAAFGVPYRDDGLDAQASVTSCWHDCSGRCWHACSE